MRSFDGTILSILDILEVNDFEVRLVLEVAQHLEENMVRPLAMDSADGLTCGQSVVDTGASICVSVAEGTLGRIINILRETFDELGSIDTTRYTLAIRQRW